MNENLSTVQAVPCPPPCPLRPISLRIPVDLAASKTLPQLDWNAGREALARKRAGWAELDLRQDFADAAHMRQVLVTAGIRVPATNEPATPKRVKAVLRRAYVGGPLIRGAVGTNVVGFLELNPNLPLWAAVALILEATGLFTPKALE
jgi:hypothetical protein